MIYSLPLHIVRIYLIESIRDPGLFHAALWRKFRTATDVICTAVTAWLTPDGFAAGAILFGGVPPRCDTLSWLHAGCGAAW
jgi:hypothetical protein